MIKNKAGNSAVMKSNNRRIILNKIRQEPVSRAELARMTGLTRAAVSIITDELVASGLIVERGTGEAYLGRKPVLLDINPSCFYAAGLYISRGFCSLSIVDLKGNLVVKKEVTISEIKNPYDAIERFAGEARTLCEAFEIRPEKLLGLGISAPGPLDVYSGTILNPPNFEMWHGISIVREMQKELPYDIFLENNSIALTLAEKNYGAGINLHSFMLLAVDTGIGAGIIIDDQLYRGGGGFGSEVGHASIDMNGKMCDCGNRGCLEIFASIPAVLEEARIYNAGIASWNEIVDKAASGDGFYAGIIDKEARYLAAGIVNAMNILELEAVILAGSIRYRPGILLDKILGYVNKSTITRNIHKIQILSSSLTEDADLISAAVIVIEKFYNGEVEVV